MAGWGVTRQKQVPEWPHRHLEGQVREAWAPKTGQRTGSGSAPGAGSPGFPPGTGMALSLPTVSRMCRQLGVSDWTPPPSASGPGTVLPSQGRSRPVLPPGGALSPCSGQQQPEHTAAWGPLARGESQPYCLEELSDSHLKRLLLRNWSVDVCCLVSWFGVGKGHPKIQSRTSNSAASGSSHTPQTCQSCDHTGAG